MTGGILGGRDAAAQGFAIGAGAGYIVGLALNRKIGLDWDSAQEDAADDFALIAVMSQYYDAREVPKLFALMEGVSRFDDRIQLGFLGHRNRILQRRDFSKRALQGALQAQYNEILNSGKMRGTTPEFNQVMADLKRDNGIEAYQFDMFDMSKRNLQQAVSMRSDDARANFYYGCVLKLVGRTSEDKTNAKRYLENAIRLDVRHTIPEALLQRALLTMESPDAASQSVALRALKDYVETFQQRKCADSRCLPPNLENCLFF